MMLSSLIMLILAIVIYNSFSQVISAGVPKANFFQKISLIDDNVPPRTKLEYLNHFEYKFESLSRIINKMDNTLQELQEKSNTWAIFHHHINSWNEGMRILENKLDLLKRSHEDQQKEFEKLELLGSDHKTELLFEDIKQFLNSERKTKNDMTLKLNTILKHLQGTSMGNNERKSHNKMDNIMAPIGISQSTQGLGTNISNKIENLLNSIAHQMALQKDLKQLNSLEKRNSKSLENINQAVNNDLDKQDEIITRLQKSNECCYSLSSELTTFTESSDILLKRIEKLVRNVSEKLNNIEAKTISGEHQEGHAEIYDSEERDENKNIEDLDMDSVVKKNELEKAETTNANNVNGEIHTSITEFVEYDAGHEVEIIKHHLNGCHELLDELTDEIDDDSARVDGIYKFSSPDINEDERDFNERYCVFSHSVNNMSELPWTVIQRRGPYQQQENFNRSWSEYRNGFGRLSHDFWFGNEFMHRLVYNDDYELRIELEDFDGTQKWAQYSLFRIDSEKYNYNLLIGEYSGNAEDAMIYHNDNDFSTYDKRNDKTVDACCSCAMGYGSGWWFDNCSEANLNGIYHSTPLDHNYIGIMWELWHGDYSLKKTRMMIRPRTTNIHKNVRNNEDYRDYTEDP